MTHMENNLKPEVIGAIEEAQRISHDPKAKSYSNFTEVLSDTFPTDSAIEISRKERQSEQ